MRACVASSYSRNSNSASLNRHIALTYRLDLFSPGFVEILAAELTFESSDWFQGTADAVRRAMRHFVQYQADYYMILAGDHLYRMDFGDLVKSHVDSGADITIAAHPVSTPDATEMGIFSFDDRGQIVGFEEKPSIERLAALHASAPTGSIASVVSPERPHVASMGIYLFFEAEPDLGARAARRNRLRPRDHPAGHRGRRRFVPTSSTATGPTSARWSRSMQRT